MAQWAYATALHHAEQEDRRFGHLDGRLRTAIEQLGVNPHRVSRHVVTGISDVVKNLTPPKAVQRIKPHLRRECRKPLNMKVRTYMHHLL